MKNYIQKWKSLNKNGLKLSLICGLNWLIRFIANSQFYLYSAVFLGFLTYYMSHELQFFTLRILELIIALTMAVGLINMALSREAKKVKHAILMGVMYLFFLAGNSYIKEHALTEFMVNRLLSFWIISLVFAALVTFIQPRLSRYYLFKNVINKEYLGIRKLTDDLPPQPNLYVDADEEDPDKRMIIINQNVIKPPYQEVVELSYLNREIITAIRFRLQPFEKENERTFIDDDTIYYPIFTVHPFGNVEGKSDFYHTLMKFKLSRKAAFTKNGDGLLKRDF
ncbi:hypothetical protein StDouc24_00905 [Streptococcus thermophilus]|uniref:hypothetical protein n=1 Tax=Streptococcus thermophilus TaxID=1308 RepID=UPI001C649F31|nr:hypothetical protein [Streptococcus thermophilus]MBW7797184.1 hypothetical protein [Streptococcus thermophilus]